MTKLYPPTPEPTPEIKRDRRLIVAAIAILATLFAFASYVFFPYRKDTELLHVSYDASREYYAALNEAYYQTLPESDRTRIVMSHAGSVRQADNLAHGQIADVVSLASHYDLQTIVDSNGCAASNWREQFPFDSSPFHSTIALVVRRGNPKQIHDWEDLWRTEVKLALPSPLRSGAGRWAFLALSEAARELSPQDASELLKLQDLYLRIRPVDAGARDALSLFARRSDLDAFLTWESDALMLDDLGFRQLEAVHFPRSIRATPQIAILLCHAERRGTLEAARMYLNFHFSETGQRLAAKHHLRPANPDIASAVADQFPATGLFSVGKDRWEAAFATGGFYLHLEALRIARLGGLE